MFFTPSASSSAVAGAGVCGVGWSIVFKIEKLAGMFGLGRFVSKDKILGWVNKNKTVTLIGTEVVNFGVHGVTSASAVTFALGSTIVNIFMIMFVVPVYCATGRVFGRKKTHA